MNNSASLRVVCFGDSITGYRPEEAYRHQYLKFSDLLQLMLEVRLGVGRALVLNRGFAGQNSSHALARLQEDVLSEHPDIVIVLIGGNDQGEAKVETEQSHQNLHDILSAVQQSGSKVLALKYHLLPGEDDGAAWHWLDDNNSLIAEVADSLSVPTLDMAPIMQSAAAEVPREELVNFDDGVHLNPGGELVYARAIFARLEELGWTRLTEA
jgi:lysophospholipase L1-like esterase